MPNLGTPELLIIAFVVILLFGSKKLPEAARSVGRSLRIFKAETRGLGQDDQPQAAPAVTVTPQAQPVATPQPAPGVTLPSGTVAVNGRSTPSGDTSQQ